MGIRIESQDVAQADARLEHLAHTAGRTERATDGLNTTFRRDREVFVHAANDASRLTQAQRDLTGTSGRLTTAQRMASGAMQSQHMAVQALRPAVVGLVGVLGPLVGIVGAAAAVVGGLTYAWMDGERAALSYEKAVTGVGRTAGLTAGRLQQLAAEGAKQGDISVRSAQQQATAYLQTGRIGENALQGLLAVGKDYASFMGVDAASATKQLAQAMEDPHKAGEQMTRTFGLLTQEQLKQIEAAMKAGDQAKAQAILLGELDKAVTGHAENVSEITSAWDAVSNSISNAITKFGEWLYVTDTEKLAKMDRDIAKVQRGDGAGDLGIMTSRRNALAFQIGYDNAARANAARQAQANQRAQTVADNADPVRRTRAARSSGKSDEEREYERLIAASQGMVENMQRERREMGLTEAQLVRLNAVRQARELVGTNTQAGVELANQILDEATALISAMADFDLVQPKATNLTPLNVEVPEMITNVQLLADEMRLLDDLARDMAAGLSSAFGDSGAALGDMLTTLTGHRSRLSAIDKAIEDGILTTSQAERERSQAQIQNYGDMAAAARGFFEEGSEGYRVMMAVEQAFRLQQMIGMIQSIFMGQSETAATLAQNTAKTSSFGIMAVVRAIASLPFPFNLAAGAATLAAVVAVGAKMTGGVGGGSRGATSAESEATNSVRSSTNMGQARVVGGNTTTIRVIPNDDRFSAYVDSRAQPAAAAAYRASVTTSRGVIPAEQTRRDRFKLGEKSAYGR